MLLSFLRTGAFDMTEEIMAILIEMVLNSDELLLDYMDEEDKAKKIADLRQYILSAIDMIGWEGVTLDYESESDLRLITMYAMWLYEKRKTTGSKYTSYYIQNMPRMLRWNLNNRLFRQKASETV